MEKLISNCFILFNLLFKLTLQYLLYRKINKMKQYELIYYI